MERGIRARVAAMLGLLTGGPVEGLFSQGYGCLGP